MVLEAPGSDGRVLTLETLAEGPRCNRLPTAVAPILPHHPVCVRIATTGGGTKLQLNSLDGKGGYEPGRVAIDRNITLGDEDWKNLDRYLEQASFWTMSTPQADDGGISCDGDQLVVEGIRGGTYHVVDRWMPDPAYEKLCRHMLDLTGLDVQKAWTGYHTSE